MQTIFKGLIALSMGLSVSGLNNLISKKRTEISMVNRELEPDAYLGHVDYANAMEYHQVFGKMIFKDLEFPLCKEHGSVFYDRTTVHERRILFEHPVCGDIKIDWKKKSGEDITDCGLYRYVDYSETYKRNIVKEEINIDWSIDEGTGYVYGTAYNLDIGSYCLVFEGEEHSRTSSSSVIFDMEMYDDHFTEDIEFDDNEILKWETNYEFENYEPFDSTYKFGMGQCRPGKMKSLILSDYNLFLDSNESTCIYACDPDASDEDGYLTDVHVYTYDNIYYPNEDIISYSVTDYGKIVVKGLVYGHTTLVIQSGDLFAECNVYVDMIDKNKKRSGTGDWYDDFPDSICETVGQIIMNKEDQYFYSTYTKENVNTNSLFYLFSEMYYSQNHDIVTDFYLFKGNRKLTSFRDFLASQFQPIIKEITNTEDEYQVKIERDEINQDQLNELHLYLVNCQNKNEEYEIPFDGFETDPSMVEAFCGKFQKRNSESYKDFKLTKKDWNNYIESTIIETNKAITYGISLQIGSSLTFETDEYDRDISGVFYRHNLKQKRRTVAMSDYEILSLNGTSYSGRISILKNQEEFENDAKPQIDEYSHGKYGFVYLNKEDLGFTNEYINYSTETKKTFDNLLSGTVLRQRSGLINADNKKYLTLSPKRKGKLPDSYIGFIFNKPIYSVQFGAAIWGVDEDLDGNSLIAMYSYINGGWEETKVFDPKQMSTSKDYLCKYHFFYPTSGSKMCYGFRFEVLTIKTNYDRNRGRVVLDDIRVTTARY